MIILELSDEINEDLISQTNQLFIDVYGKEGFTLLELVKEQFTVEKIKQSTAKILITLVNQKVVGVVVYAGPTSQFKRDANKNEAEFRLLAVSIDYRKKGIAEALITQCINLAKTDKVAALVLSTQKVKMIAAQNLYTKLGFSRNPTRDRVNTNGTEYLIYEMPLF